MARMDRLQDALTSQKEAGIVNFGAAERAERIAKGTSDEVRTMGEQLNAMVRQIRHLESDRWCCRDCASRLLRTAFYLRPTSRPANAQAPHCAAVPGSPGNVQVVVRGMDDRGVIAIVLRRFQEKRRHDPLRTYDA